MCPFMTWELVLKIDSLFQYPANDISVGQRQTPIILGGDLRYAAPMVSWSVRGNCDCANFTGLWSDEMMYSPGHATGPDNVFVITRMLTMNPLCLGHISGFGGRQLIILAKSHQ